MAKTPNPQVLARVSLCWPPMSVCRKNVYALRACKRSNRDFLCLYTNTYTFSLIQSSSITRRVLRCLLGFLVLWGQKPCGGKYVIDNLLKCLSETQGAAVTLMHQSIPAVPIPPGNRGAFAHVVSPGDWALAYPGATPGHLTHVFSKDGWVYWEGRGLSQRLACPSGTRKTCRCFKDMFSHSYISLNYL